MTPPGRPPVEPPLALLAELTHRCPLRCPYCSNPLALERAGAELDTETWQRVLGEAAAMGVLQVHFSGGEPLARRDLAALVGHATKAGLYGNLITSGIGLDAARIGALVEAGLEHVQLSLQDTDPAKGDRIAGLTGAQAQKHQAARLVIEAGLPLTVNAVVHRQNLDRLGDMIAAVDRGYYLKRVSNGQADWTSEFMFGITCGYEIRNGKLGRAIRDTTVSGIAFDMLKTVTYVGDELQWMPGTWCGKKQLIPVCIGGPALKCRITLGGQ